MTDSNSNCLEGIKCPHCGADEAFYIDALVRAYVTDDGAEPADYSSFSWDDAGYAECAECAAYGTLADFRIANPESKAKPPEPASESDIAVPQTQTGEEQP